jgi:tetratricopeptide (TPR) repeat protein
VFMLARLAGALRDQPSRERRSRLSQEAVELARRATGAEALAYALEARVAAITGPDTIEECVALGRQMEQVALQSGDPEQIAAAYTHQIAAQMIAGDLTGATRRVADALRAAHALRQPARMWVAAVEHATVELAAGHLETAETLIEEALALGERSQPDMAVPAHHQQRHCLLELTGSLADGEAGIADLVASSPRLSFRCFLAHIHAVNGRRDDAARAVRTLACEGLPLDANWPLAVSVLADACAQLDDGPSAALLYRQIEPYAHLFAADSTDGFRGSLARSLGRLATTLERFDEAERHFLAAAADNERVGAPAWHAVTLRDHGQMLLRRGEPGQRARRLIETALAHCERLGITSPDT